MKRRLQNVCMALLWFVLVTLTAAAQRGELPIGQIQGETDESPYRNQVVAFRGVVTAVHEDQNSRGVIYYTLFVQAVPGEDDGNPATSDALPVFTGRDQPAIQPGSLVRVVGKVTEFYGFTEIDDDNLSVVVEGTGQPLPEPVLVNPPPANHEQLAYLEAYEGMRVTLGDTVRVAGPSHSGCGFAVLAGDPVPEAAVARVFRREATDPIGHVIPVLFPSDVDCQAMPDVKAGDLISGVKGPLIYNFDQFKILLDSPEELIVQEAPLPTPELLSTIAGEQISVVTFNLEDYFDTKSDTGLDSEPVLLPEELTLRESRVVLTITELLRCPTLIGLQEVEHAELLVDLAAALAESCGFVYEVTHEDSPDGRGIDNALLTDPRRATVLRHHLHQACSPVPTEVRDASNACEEGQWPLFGRPPLQVDLTIDSRPHTVFVNHFKSKRGGEAETALERLAQALFQNALAGTLLDADPTARLIVLGDFNDYEGAPSRLAMVGVSEGGQLLSGLDSVPEESRYSYNFGGVVELLDDILLSPALAEARHEAGIVHSNTEFPYRWRLSPDETVWRFRASDHDVPWLILYEPPAPTATPPPTATAMPAATPTPVATLTLRATATPPPPRTATTAAPEEIAAVAGDLPAMPSPTAMPSVPTATGSTRGLLPWAAASAGLAAVFLAVYAWRQRS